jgi:hypothetical protein
MSLVYVALFLCPPSLENKEETFIVKKSACNFYGVSILPKECRNFKILF